MKIGLISDTHGFLHPRVRHHFNDCDEVWHAGDIGTLELLEEMEGQYKIRAVFGNIDNDKIRVATEEVAVFEVDGLKVLMSHIMGYPGRYNPTARELIQKHKPGMVICGHSHILKVIYDKKNMHLHVNPGAAGKKGWHKVMTLIKFDINQGAIENMKVIELGARGKEQ